jgi:hypothetical protein
MRRLELSRLMKARSQGYLLVGQNNAPGEDRERRCVIFGTGLQQARLGTNALWIVPTAAATSLSLPFFVCSGCLQGQQNS